METNPVTSFYVNVTFQSFPTYRCEKNIPNKEMRKNATNTSSMKKVGGKKKNNSTYTFCS